MSYGGGRSPEETVADEVSGLSLIKEIWNIREPAPRREPVPSKVSTDIYKVPPTTSRFPHRSRPSQ